MRESMHDHDDPRIGGEPGTLLDLLAFDAAEGTRAAILGPGRKDLARDRLLPQVGAVVERLYALGVGRGDRVAVVLPNGPDMAVAFLGVAAGAVCAPLNPAYREPEFDFYLSDLNARAVILPAGTGSAARAAARTRSIPVLELCLGSEAGVFSLDGGPTARKVSTGPAAPGDVALVLHTSGTTSRPKIVPLTHANLCASARNIAVSLELTATDRCLNIMPLFHVHGLVAALLGALGAGGSVVCTPGFDGERFSAWLDEFQPTWYTAVPTMHQAILARAGALADAPPRSSLRFIRSCSSALPPQVMARLEDLFGVPVVEAYGMTEAAHQIACNPLPPRPRKARSVGVAAGPDVAIMDAGGNLLGPESTGEIVIRGPNVTPGYENNPTANERAFTSGWFRTGDEGTIDAGGYVFITDRIKEIINRGGEKISPREVDEALMDHPAVQQAVAFAVPHPQLGEDVVAAVVLRPGVSATAAELREFTADRLAAHKVPRQVLMVGEIPKGPTGKLQRIKLNDLLGDRLKPAYVAPRDAVEARLEALWGEILGVERVGVQDNFFLLGGSSLPAAQMLAGAAEEFHVALPLDHFFRHSTLGDLADAIRYGQGAGHEPGGGLDALLGQPVVVPVQPNGSRPPLFLAVTGLGWEARHVAKYLGPDQPVFGLRPTALLADARGAAGARNIAAHYVEAIRGVRPHGPYFLAGGCAAGIVAFEMGRQLMELGEDVPLVVLVDVDYPLPAWVPTALAVKLMRLPREWARVRRLRLRQQWESVTQHLKRFAAWIADTIRPAPSTPDLQKELWRLRDSVWRYTPAAYPGRLALLLPEQTGVWFHHDRRRYWRRIAGGGSEIQPIPGEHSAALQEPHAAAAARVIRACMDRALAGSSRSTEPSR